MLLTHTAFMLFCHKLFFSIRDSVAEQTLTLVRLYVILETLPGSGLPSDILKLPLISQI